jgi:hypothetical protein
MKQLFIGLDVNKKTWTVTIQEDPIIFKDSPLMQMPIF